MWSNKWCAHCLKVNIKKPSKFIGCMWACEKGSQQNNNYYTCVWPTFEVNANYCCLWHEGQGQAKIWSPLLDIVEWNICQTWNYECVVPWVHGGCSSSKLVGC